MRTGSRREREKLASRPPGTPFGGDDESVWAAFDDFFRESDARADRERRLHAAETIGKKKCPPGKRRTVSGTCRRPKRS